MINRSMLKCLLIMALICSANCKRYPVILLSGYMGNQLNSRLEDADAPKGCLRNSFISVPLWVDAIAANLFPECWQHKMILHYDKKLHKSFSNKGVHIHTNQFGSVNGVDYIASFPQQNRISEYYILLIRSLELHAGYERNKDIFGAPYDWRKGPHEQPEFFERLRQLVERAYFVNNNTPVLLLGHSMGGNYVYIFLRNQSAEWKKKFVRSAVFLAVPWGGNVKYMYSYLYNDDFAGDILPMFREIERNFPSLAFLLPNRRVFGNDVVLETPSNKYTSDNMDKLMIKLGRPGVIPMWRDTKNLMDPFVHPGTDVVCVVGIGFNTIRKVVLTKDALIDHKYRTSLRRRRSIGLRQFRKQSRKVFLRANDKLSSKQKNELYRSVFNRTSFYDTHANWPKNFISEYKLSSMEGTPRNPKKTQHIIEQIRGKFNTMFSTIAAIGDQLSQFVPISFSNARRMRDNLFNSKRIYYYWHAIESILNPVLPENAYDVIRGRYIFMGEGDSFVNIESGLKCLDWYSPKSKHEFYFDLINDSHLGMLRNKKSVEYYTKLIMAIS